MATTTDRNQGNLDNRGLLPVWEKKFWHKSAPDNLLSALKPEDRSHIAELWAGYLTARVEPTLPTQLFSVESSCVDDCPLGWALPKLDRQTTTLITMLEELRYSGETGAANTNSQAVQEIILPWLAEAEDQEATLDTAYQSLALARSLASLTNHLPQEIWWLLFLQLVQVSEDATAVELDDCPLTHQLLAGELSLTLAYSFPEINPARNLLDSASKQLSLGLVELLDGQGMPNHKDLKQFRALVACWLRSAAISKASEQKVFNTDANDQFLWTVTCLLRLLRCDGTQMFSPENIDAWQPVFFEQLINLAGSADDCTAADILLPNDESLKPKPMKKIGRLKPAYDSQWAGISIMRPKWQRAGLRLGIAYEDEFNLELNSGSDVVLAGQWQTSITVDGKPINKIEPWQQICWTSDRDADYLELHADFENGVVVERHLLLSRKDRFMFIADAIKTDEEKPAGKIEYECQIPTGPNMKFETVAETRECFLMGKKSRAMLLPLALNEWQIDPRHGEIQGDDSQITLTQSCEAARLFCPMFIDLDSKRMVRETTWRQLTVAYERATVPNDEAVGYRVQVGKEQWLMYRSLAEKKCRTLMGHHLGSDFLVARFRKKEVEPIMETE